LQESVKIRNVSKLIKLKFKLEKKPKLNFKYQSDNHYKQFIVKYYYQANIYIYIYRQNSHP